MANIQSLGIGSGLLTDDLVDKIITAEREPVEARLNNEQELTEARISAYGEIVSSVDGFSVALQTLTLPSTFNASTASSTSESFLTATASSIATSGSYVVEVTSLAQVHSIASAAYSELDAVVGSGSLTFRLGTISYDGDNVFESFSLNPDSQTKTITIDSTNNTLAGIRDAVNEADFGVQASIVDDGSGYRLLFSSDETGAKNSIEIVALGDAGIRAFNFNVDSENASLNALTDSGTTDLSTGAGLDTAAMSFQLTYNSTVLDIVVASDGAIDTTEEVIAAVQAALDVQLIANGFAAGAVVADGTDDTLSFSSLGEGFDESLQISQTGSAGLITGSAAISDGFDFANNNATFSVSIDGAAAQAITLDTLTADRQATVDLINAKFLAAGIDSDITASLSANNELVFTRSSLGSTASISISAIDVAGTAGSSELNLSIASVSGLDGFGLDDTASVTTGSVRLIETIQATDAKLTVNGLAITRDSNLVAGVISGTTLNLKAVTVGPVTIEVKKDPETIIEKIQAFVDAYNQLKSLSDELTNFDASAGENGRGSILIGDSTLRNVVSGIDSLLRTSLSGLDGGVRALSEVGITTDQNNNFQLFFDAAIFSTKFETQSEDILALFANAGTTTDSQIDYATSTSETQPGTYDVTITNLATVGSYQGVKVAALAAGNLVIDDDNDNFSISLNGVSADITLTQGTYLTATDLAEQIQLQINSDTTYKNGNHSVSVTYNAIDSSFEIDSNVYGSDSEVSFTAIDANVANSLGFILDSQGAFEGNKLAGLATTSGNSSDNFLTAVVLDADTSFDLSINGISSSLITIPGDAGSPQTYTSGDDLLVAIQAQIDADEAFQVKAATTNLGDVITAGQDFSVLNRSITFSLDGGSSETTVLVDGDAATIAYGGETIGTLANSLAAVQAAIDSTSLSGQVTALLDASDNIYFATTATGSASSLKVTSDGTGAVMTGSSALTGGGFDFATTNATFDIAIDSETPITITLSELSSDPANTALKVQEALDSAGIGSRVKASVDGSNQLVLTRVLATGDIIEIAVSNLNATALAELGLSASTANGLDGFSMNATTQAGSDAINVTVAYDYDSASTLGRLVFSGDNNDDIIEFDNVSTNASNALGIFIGDGTVTTSSTGLDVGGTINGIIAKGSGQSLRAEAGNTPAKPGFYLNAAIGNLASSSSGDSFKITVDGVISSNITLGTITDTDPDTVAAGIATAINSNPLLQAGGVSVTVEYDPATGGFGIISTSTGITSSVNISELNGNAASILGFAIGKGAKGAIGSVAKGEPDASSGLKLTVSGGALGDRGSVTFIRGIADQLDVLLDNYLGSGGILSARTSGLNKVLEGIAEDRVDMEANLDASEERLRVSFLANDLIISSLNTTADFLTSQLSILESTFSSKD